MGGKTHFKTRTSQEQIDTGQITARQVLKIIIELCFHLSNGSFPQNKDRTWFKNWIRDNI